MYDVAGLDHIASVRRVLEIAVLDALGLANSLARRKVLIGAVSAAGKLLEAEREEGWGWDGRTTKDRQVRQVSRPAVPA